MRIFKCTQISEITTNCDNRFVRYSALSTLGMFAVYTSLTNQLSENEYLLKIIPIEEAIKAQTG